MKWLFILSLTFGSLLSVKGQLPPESKTNKPKGSVDLNCIYRNKYSETERLRFYPFNVADTIKLISFRYHDINYPVDKDHIATDSLVEQKVLSKEEVATLTDILYNNSPRRPAKIHSFLDCFEPRNAVLFFDKSGKLKEYMLICFHCRRFGSSSPEIFGEWDTCNQKSEMIRMFFISAGVKFGTDLTIENYPGECDVCR